MSQSHIRLKSNEDIEHIAKAGRIVAEFFKYIREYVVPGVTTARLDEIATDFAYDHNAIPVFREVPGYHHSTCISINEQIVHGIPGNRVVRDHELVKIDYGIKLNGYIGDACMSFIVGTVPKRIKKLVDVTEQSLYLGIEAAQPGNHIGDIGYAIQKYVERNGFSVVRQFVGHGVGYELHEPPNVPHYGQRGTGIELEPGMVIAIEPMINAGTWKAKILSDGWTAVTMDGKWSAQFEHTIAIKDDGPQILTMV